MGASRFKVFFVDAIVADLRRRHRHDLSEIRRIGQDFLIPRHAGIEDRFPAEGGRSSKRLAPKNCPIFKSEHSVAIHEVVLNDGSAPV